MRGGRNRPATLIFWAVGHEAGREMPHWEQEPLLGPGHSLWRGREELPLTRHGTGDLSYFSCSFLKSLKKQLLQQPRLSELLVQKAKGQLASAFK